MMKFIFVDLYYVFLFFFRKNRNENSIPKISNCKQGFGRACGNRRAIVPMDESQRHLILEVHNGMRSLVASGLLKGYQPAKRMGYIVSI